MNSYFLVSNFQLMLGITRNMMEKVDRSNNLPNLFINWKYENKKQKWESYLMICRKPNIKYPLKLCPLEEVAEDTLSYKTLKHWNALLKVWKLATHPIFTIENVAIYLSREIWKLTGRVCTSLVHGLLNLTTQAGQAQKIEEFFLSLPSGLVWLKLAPTPPLFCQLTLLQVLKVKPILALP